MPSLLADVVASRQLPAEPVATDSMVHLLGRSSAARAAIGTLLTEICPGASTRGLSFTGQVISGEDAGRPDIVATDDDGIRLVIEAKFDAELTPAQLGTVYLDRLPAGRQGALLFLVPPDRLPAIWPQLLAGPGQLDSLPAVDLRLADKEFLSHEVGDGRVIGALSWERLLGVIRRAMEAELETGNLADLAQIEGLVKWRSRTGWTPLLPGDLPDRAGRQLAPLVDSVLKSAALVSATKTKNGSADGGPGRYISSSGGWTIWVGVWARWWGEHGGSPAWAQVRASAHYPIDVIAEVLSRAVAKVIARPQRSDVLVRLDVPRGVERGDVEESLVLQLRNVVAALDSLGSPPADQAQFVEESTQTADDPRE